MAQLSTSSVAELSGGFHALSEPLRLKILELLQQQEFCVGDMCTKLATAQSKLSFHLKVLREAGLVISRQEGRWMYYSLNVPQFSVLEQYLVELRTTHAENAAKASASED